MKKTRSNQLFMVCTVITIILFLPVLASAGAVQWLSETYTAYTHISVSQNSLQQQSFGPPLPVSAYTDDGFGFRMASSNITSSSMNIISNTSVTPWAPGDTAPRTANASASFSGAFTAVNPLFQFSYNYDYLSDNIYTVNGNFWISVYDSTDSLYLYNSNLIFTSNNTSASDVLNINLPYGHVINVDYGIAVGSIIYPGSTRDNYDSLNLTYSSAVVPEPISSILFIAGGSLLAGRRFIKRQA